MYTLYTVVSFARTPLEELSAKVEQITAFGWHECEGRGNPWVAKFAKDFARKEDASEAELRTVMGDYWVDTDRVRELSDPARQWVRPTD